MNGRLLRVLLTACCIAACSSPTHALAEEPEAGRPGNFLVGGIASIPEFEGSGDSLLVPLIIGNVTVFGARTEIEGIRSINVDLVKDSFWRAGPSFSAQLPRNDSADNPAVALLPEVGFAVEAGGFVGFETPFSDLAEGRLSGEIAVRADVAGAHNGSILTADLDYFFAVHRQLRFLVGVNATFADGDYFDSYFSVDEETARRAGLRAFDAGPGLKDIGLEASAIVSFSPKYAIFLRGAYNRLLGDAADSPIVADIGSEHQVFIGAGLFVAF